MSSFMAELARKTPSTLQEFMNMANDFVNTEDTLIILNPRSRESLKKDCDGGQKARRDQHESRCDGNVRRHNGNYVHHSSVHNQEKKKEARQDDDNRQQKGKYYTYHKINGHRTKDFHNLK